MALNLWISPGLWSQLISGIISSVPTRHEGKMEGILGPLEHCRSAPLTSAGALCSPGDANEQKRADRPRAAVQGLFFVVMVGLVHLSICVIQRGEQQPWLLVRFRGHERVPLPSPQALTHLKKAEQQGHSTDVGKGFPRESRMVVLTWVSLGPPPWGQHKHLLVSP